MPRTLWLILAACGLATTALASGVEPLDDGSTKPVTGPFAASGHPEARLCAGDYQVGRLSKALRLQFQDKGAAQANLDEAVTLVSLLAPALDGQGVRFLSVSAVRPWHLCVPVDEPDYLFWRDADGNWRMPRIELVDYLERHLASMKPDLRNGAAGAYVLYHLGDVQEYLGMNGLDALREAFAVLQAQSDPDGILRLVSASLILQRQTRAPKKEWLDAYARSAEASGEAWDQIPLVKVRPVYPLRAARRRESGYVVVSFTVDETGAVKDEKVIEESPKGLFGKSALNAARQFRYLPKVVAGRRVPVHDVRNRLVFDGE